MKLFKFNNALCSDIHGRRNASIPGQCRRGHFSLKFGAAIHLLSHLFFGLSLPSTSVVDIHAMDITSPPDHFKPNASPIAIIVVISIVFFGPAVGLLLYGLRDWFKNTWRRFCDSMLAFYRGTGSNPSQHPHQNLRAHFTTSADERINRNVSLQQTPTENLATMTSTASVIPGTLSGVQQASAIEMQTSGNYEENANRTESIMRLPSIGTRSSSGVDEVDQLLYILPKIKVSHKSGEICSICLDALSTELVTMCACSHQMHSLCLESWLKKSKTLSCPICRTNAFTGLQENSTTHSPQYL